MVAGGPGNQALLVQVMSTVFWLLQRDICALGLDLLPEHSSTHPQIHIFIA